MSLFKGAEKEVQPQGERKSLLKTPLLPHQQRVVNKIKNKPGILMYHGVGLGKSLGSLAALDSLGQRGTVVTPAALKSNILKERDKHFNPGLEMDVDSLENIARKQTAAKNPTLLIDESHKLRDPASKSLQALKKINKNVDKTILMTGTPMVNSPADIAPQINLVSHDNILPENRAEFEKKYVYNKTVNPSFWQSLKGIKPGEVPVLNRNEKGNLQKIFSDWVDYEKGNREGLPDVEEQEIKVPMSKGQLAIYDTVMNQAPSWVASKIRSNLPPNKQESQQLNAYLQAARQVANTTAPFIQNGKAESPKIQKAFEELKKMMDTNPNGKAIIYSNYLKAGLDPYKELLTQNNIPFGEFTGSVHQKGRDQMVKDYNEGKLKALLLSSAGQTGLDLKNTNLVQLMESGWNEPSLEQAKARAIRYMSHSSLPPEQRKVLVQKFLSTRPETLSQRLGLSDKEFAVDEYLQTLSKNKANLISQFEELMKQPQQVQQKVAMKQETKNKLKSTAATSGILLGGHVGAATLGSVSEILGEKALGKDFNESLRKSGKNPNVMGVKEYGKAKKTHISNKTSNLADQMGIKSAPVNIDSTASYTPNVGKFKEKIELPFHAKDDTILHELGHQKNWSKIPNKLKIPTIIMKNLTGPLPSTALTAYTANQENPDSRLGLGFLAASAPTLIDEGAASARAFNTLRKMHGWKTGLKKSWSLIPAFGGYALNASAPLIGTQVNKWIRGNQEKIASLKPVSLSNSLKEVLKAAKRSGFKGQNFNPNKFKFNKLAKVEDKVLKFTETKDYSFLFKNIKSPKFRSLLKKQNEDPAFTNFVNNMGKHYSAARKGESFEVPSEKNPNKIYKVRKHSDKTWTCSCPSYQFVKSTINGDCKHIDKIKNEPNTIKVAEAIVPHKSQSNQKSCSSASLRMVLSYYGDERSEDELSKLIGVHSCGADGGDIKEASEKLGYSAQYRSISTQEAINLLDKGIPIIMDGKSFKYDGKFHWTVLCDIQLDNNKAILADPNYDGKYRHLTLKELDYYWNSKEMYKPHRSLKRYGVIVKKKS